MSRINTKPYEQRLTYTHQVHELPPVYDENSEILILGSFPSVKSREQGFFYGHPLNRFWKVLAQVFSCETPQSTEEKKLFLLEHHIAVWDVIASCDIVGSSDSSITNVKVNDFTSILSESKIKSIFVNGATAKKLYDRYAIPQTKREAIQLPSTSPANARYSLECLCRNWSQIVC